MSKPRKPGKTADRNARSNQKHSSLPRPRLRRRPEDAESEILETAEKFLRHKPFHAMTVDVLMARTGLSRPSFYEYFRDRYQLVNKLVDKLLSAMYPVSDRWFSGTGVPELDLREGFEGLIRVYRDHLHLMRALAEAATQDRQVARAYGVLINRLTEATERRIREEIRSGRTQPLDAAETARALILMGERYLGDRLTRDPKIESRILVDTLVTIWLRVLYGTSQPQA